MRASHLAMHCTSLTPGGTPCRLARDLHCLPMRGGEPGGLFCIIRSECQDVCFLADGNNRLHTAITTLAPQPRMRRMR
jgi:hypothetical protein